MKMYVIKLTILYGLKRTGNTFFMHNYIKTSMI